MAKNEAGISLLETLVAISILSVGALSMAGVFAALNGGSPASM
jgi:Tfp pilus assembly protein PilV